MRVLGFILLLSFTPTRADNKNLTVVVRNGHHRATAVIILLKKGQIAPETVIGKFENKPVTAIELLNWYQSGKLLAYNTGISPEQVMELVNAFNPTRALKASESNPAGGVLITLPQPNEKLLPFGNTKEYGSLLGSRNCGRLIEKLSEGAK